MGAQPERENSPNRVSVAEWTQPFPFTSKIEFAIGGCSSPQIVQVLISVLVLGQILFPPRKPINRRKLWNFRKIFFSASRKGTPRYATEET